MSFFRAVGGLTLPGALNGTVAVTCTDPDLGTFQPKIVLLFSSGIFASADTPVSSNTSTGRVGFGFFTSTTDRRAAGMMARDNLNPSNGNSEVRTDACFLGLHSTNNFTGGRWDVSAISSSGFTLICDDATAGGGLRVHYLALGGTDITNVTIGTALATTGTGSQSFTGLGFRPDALLFLDALSTTNAVNGATGSANFGAAAGTGTPNQWVIANKTSSGNTPSITYGYLKSGEAYATATELNTTGSTKYECSVTSLDADGFTINKIKMPQNNNLQYLALKGCGVTAGTFVLNNSGASVSGFGFQPKALLLATHGAAESTAGTLVAHNRISMGVAASAASRVAQTMLDVNGQNPTSVLTALRDDCLLTTSTTASTFTQDALVDLASFDSDGFTYAVDDTSSTLFAAGYLAFGPTPAGGGGGASTRRSFVSGMLG